MRRSWASSTGSPRRSTRLLGRLPGQPALPTQLARRADLLDEVEDVRVTLPQFLVRRDEAHPALGAVHSSTAIPDLAHAKNLGPGTAGCKPLPAHSRTDGAAQTKFTPAIGKVDAKGGCVRTGDGSTIEEFADRCVSNIVALTSAAVACRTANFTCTMPWRPPSRGSPRLSDGWVRRRPMV